MTGSTTGGARVISLALASHAAREPRQALRVSLAILRGLWCKLYYRLRGTRLRAGDDLRIFGWLIVRGPGEVILGDRVRIYGRVTPWTYAPEARITIGNDTELDGVRFGCKKEITIGHSCIIAECRILDTDFHSTRADRASNREAVRIAPVRIGDNVWIGLQAGILPGTVIGKNSVVAFGAVCVREYPENTVVMGNPARAVSPIPPAESAAVGSRPWPP